MIVTDVFNAKDGLYLHLKEPRFYERASGVLVQIFSGEGKEALVRYAEEILEYIPHAVCVGATTDGEIVWDKVTTHQTVVAVTVFEHTRVKLAVAEGPDSYENGRRLAAELVDDETKLVLLFSDGTSTNGEEFIKGFDALAGGVMIAGGMAGDNAQFRQTYVLGGKKIITRGGVGVALSSSRLRVKNFYRFNWLPIGRYFRITKAHKNRVYTIDHQTAVDLYKKYFGPEVAKKLPKVGVEFPLILRRGGETVARAVIEKRDDGSLVLAGNVSEGDIVQFGFGSTAAIMRGIARSLDDFEQMSVQSFFIYSCMARRRYIPNEIVSEIIPYACSAPTVGFFTYGEFYRFEDGSELLNETMTGVALSEQDGYPKIAGSCNIEKQLHLHEAMDTFESMAHLIERSSDELNTLIELFSQSHVVLFQWRNEEGWPVELVSQNVEELTGYTANDFLSGKISYAELIHPEDLARIEREVIEAIASGEAEFRHEPYRLRHRNGEYFWVEDFTQIKRNDKGEVTHFVGYLSDITGDLEKQRKLELYGLIFRHASEAIVITDDQNRIVDVNGAFEKLTGYTKEEAVGQNPSILKSGLHDRAFYEKMWESLTTKGEWQGEVYNKTKSGQYYVAWLSIRVIRNERGEVINYLALQTDMTEISKMHRELERLAHYDALTGLPNRVLFKDRIGQAIARHKRKNERFALLYLDLDNFKTVNDSLGHSVGDKLLQALAKRLSRNLRRNDTVSRQGGDEFLILLEEQKSAEEVKKVVEKIVDVMQAPFKINDHLLHASFSIGVALYPDDGKTFDELLQHADLAMYAAKHDGKNTYRFFDKDMLESIRSKHSLLTDLRGAVKRGDFFLEFQPKLSLKEGRIAGMEALLRWRHPRRGLVGPDEFIPVAEEHNLIIDIGRWVLKEACRTIKTLRGRYKVAVNISARQFEHPDFVEFVRQTIDRYGIDPANLELELTESVLIRNVAQSTDTMQLLKKLGVSIAIDDFGTGYSSLSYLKRFPADVIKIDRSFIGDLEKDRDDEILTDAIIQLGHTFGMKVVAEGVETDGQLRFLEANGCDEIQGYFFSRPLSKEALLMFLAERE